MTTLYKKEECPVCHHSFVSGFDSHQTRKCPACKHRFVSGAKIDHGSGCSICTARRNSEFTGKGMSNTHYKDGCPALMSDGRFITNYNSSNELTEAIRKLNGIRSPNEFRTFLQKNGKALMDSERSFVERDNTCRPSTACSQGWHDLWNKYGGNWSNSHC